MVFLGPNCDIDPKPAHEANCCILSHLTAKTLQKALYVGYLGNGQPPQVVWFGWSRFPFQKAGQIPVDNDALKNLRLRQLASGTMDAVFTAYAVSTVDAGTQIGRAHV